MNSIPGRRRFLRDIGAGLTASAWALEHAYAATQPLAQALPRIQATTTSLSSDNERQISYRHQQHLVQSTDGALHLLLNRGTLTPGPGLSLFTSYDGGSTWQFVLNFVGTDNKSTGDLQLIGDDLWIVYHTSDQSIWFAQLHYSSNIASWSLTTLQQAYTSTQWGAQNPALAVDELGTIWVGFLAKSRSRFNSVGQIRVVNRVGGGTVWTDPGLVFGPTDSRAVERSARPIYVAGGMGMVWTVREVTYWSKRTNALPDNSAWTTSTIYTGIAESQKSDPYASHFNVTTDDTGGVHLLSIEKGIESYDVLHFRYAASTDSWGAPQQVDDARNAAYAQIGVVNGKLGVAFSVQRGKSQLALSADLGSTWAHAYDLQLIPTYPGVNYNTARIELPTRCTGAMPILQQYSDSTSQKLMLFSVPSP